MTRTGSSAQQPSARRRVRPKLPASLRPGAAAEVVDEGLLEGLELRGADLSGHVARLVDVVGCRFVEVRLSGATLDKTTLLDVELTRCDLANLTLDHSSLTRAELVGCRATGLIAGGLLLRNVELRECVADLSVFRFATFANVELVDCRLQGADFVSADLRGTVFRRCDLARAELSQVQAKGAVFVDCTWDEVHGIASLSGATVVHSSPVDAHAFMVATSAGLGIRLGDPDDYA
jgi:uncharacterized protein YjbI with pentapeptide repeats